MMSVLSTWDTPPTLQSTGSNYGGNEGHADALTRKVSIRAAGFKSKFYATPLMDIAYCSNDTDEIATYT